MFGGKRSENADMVKESVILDRMAVFCTPEIMVDGKDPRFTGWVSLRDFRSASNVVSQTAIPRAHQSLGATANRRGLFRAIIDRAIGGKKAKKVRSEEWE